MRKTAKSIIGLCLLPCAAFGQSGALDLIDWVEFSRPYFEAASNTRDASPDRYRAALLQIAAAGEIAAAKGMGRPGKIDAAIAYFKLALLEEELGRSDEAKRYFDLAIARCSCDTNRCSKDDLSKLNAKLGKNW